MGCPNRELLSAYFDGEVEPPWSKAVADHVARCDRCQEVIEGLRVLQDVLHRDAEPDCLASRERTLGRLRGEQLPPRRQLWAATRATLTVPWPAVATVLGVVLIMAGFLAYFTLHPGYGRMSIRRQPTGVTEVQVAAPIKDLEFLLRSLDTQSPAQEIVITLPEDSTFIMLGEPRLLREAEYNRSGR
jgi:predicted anti-sigma-YlaC factor YlaD